MRQLSLAAAGIAALVGASVVYPARVVAQQPAPPRSSVTVVRVKPEMIDAWADFQAKRTIPAIRKAGTTQRDVYQSIYGTAGEYRIVTPMNKFADRDNPEGPIVRALGQAGANEYNDTLRKMLVSSATTIIQSIPEASFDPSPNAIHPVLVLTVNHVAPGRAGDYLGLLNGEILAANKKGMAKRYLVSRVAFGGDPNEFRQASFEDKFAALDGGSPVTRGIGQDAATKLAQRSAGIVLSSQRTVWLRMANLSFRPIT
jgi:hypothetical protein